MQTRTFGSIGKNVTIVVPFGPGSGTDVGSRLLAERLSASLGKSLVIENKPGGAGNIAMGEAARAEPDGYTLSLAPAGQLTILPHVNSAINFDPFKSFTPVSLLASVPYVRGKYYFQQKDHERATAALAVFQITAVETGGVAHHRPGALGAAERKSADHAPPGLRDQRGRARRSLEREGLRQARADDL